MLTRVPPDVEPPEIMTRPSCNRIRAGWTPGRRYWLCGTLTYVATVLTFPDASVAVTEMV